MAATVILNKTECKSGTSHRDLYFYSLWRSFLNGCCIPYNWYKVLRVLMQLLLFSISDTKLSRPSLHLTAYMYLDDYNLGVFDLIRFPKYVMLESRHNRIVPYPRMNHSLLPLYLKQLNWKCCKKFSNDLMLRMRFPISD